MWECNNKNLSIYTQADAYMHTCTHTHTHTHIYIYIYMYIYIQGWIYKGAGDAPQMKIWGEDVYFCLFIMYSDPSLSGTVRFPASERNGNGKIN